MTPFTSPLGRTGAALLSAGALTLSLSGPAVAAPPTGGQVITVRTCSEGALRKALADAPSGAQVRFGCDGTIALTPEGGGTLEVQGATPARTLTLDGNGRKVTIDGGGRLRLLVVAGDADVTLKDLTFAHGNAEIAGGGAITNFGALRTEKVSFVENRAFGRGGAIFSTGPSASLTVSNSSFTGNSTTSAGNGGGGAIGFLQAGPTTITDSRFTGNSAQSGAGGAVFGPLAYDPARTGPLTISRSTFERNQADPTILPQDLPTGGGAVAVFNRTLAIRDSSFDNNATGARLPVGIFVGGAILVSSGVDEPGAPTDPHPATLARNTFTANRAAEDGVSKRGEGGGIFINNAFAPTEITGTTMRANVATVGGAILGFTRFAVRDSLIERNVAVSTGTTPPPAGGIATTSEATLERTRLFDNVGGNCGASGPNARFILLRGVVERPGSYCQDAAR